MLGAWPRVEPSEHQGLDLIVRRLGVLAPELRPVDRDTHLAQLQRCAQAGGENVRGILSHESIVGRPRVWPPGLVQFRATGSRAMEGAHGCA